MYIIASSFYSAVQLKFTSAHFLESQLSMRKIHLTQRGCIDAFSVICYTSLNYLQFEGIYKMSVEKDR